MSLRIIHLACINRSPGMLRLMGSQRVRHDWVTELNWTEKAALTLKLTMVAQNDKRNSLLIKLKFFNKVVENKRKKEICTNSSCLFIWVVFYFPGGTNSKKNLPANAGTQEVWEETWVREIPWSRKWRPTPIFLPGKFHRQRSLTGYSPWGWKEQLSTHACIRIGSL